MMTVNDFNDLLELHIKQYRALEAELGRALRRRDREIALLLELVPDKHEAIIRLEHLQRNHEEG